MVGINLLREGLDIPEVSLILILDADKEGFLRSSRSLIQIIGRASRNEHGEVIMYADHITDSMRRAIDETNRRRNVQDEYNKANNITPKSIVKAISETIAAVHEEKNEDKPSDTDAIIEKLKVAMLQASEELRFEDAARIRDRILKLKRDKG